MIKNKPVIAVILGSDSDLGQCMQGIVYLQEMEKTGEIVFPYVHIASQHRHTQKVNALAALYSGSPTDKEPGMDMIPKDVAERISELVAKHEVVIVITAAGKANHLSGCFNAYLRFTLRNNEVIVFAIGLKGENEDDDNAALLSISQVPGINAIFEDTDGDGKQYFGGEGFLKACVRAVDFENLPKNRDTKPPPDHHDFTPSEAITKAVEKIKKKGRM